MGIHNRGSFFGSSFGLFKRTFSEWLEDKGPQLGAALAYYTVFSLAPLTLVLLAVVGLILFIADSALRRRVYSSLRLSGRGRRRTTNTQFVWRPTK